MAHQDYQEMLPAQALNALDSEDAHKLEAHLAGCSECRIELSSWEDTVPVIALAALEAEPSSQLRGRILEAVRAEETPINGTGELGGANRSRFSKVVDFDQRRLRTSSPALAWGAIAAAVLLVVLSSSILILWQQNRAARDELTRLTGQVHEAQEQLAWQRDALGIVAAPGSRMTELAGTTEMPGAHAMLAFDKNGRAILMAKGLPPPPAGKAYQLWFITGGRPLPGKLFTTDASGAGMMSDQIPGEALKAAVFAITLEPKNGVPAPTGAIYLKS